MSMKFYAVRKGLTPGIYNNWDQCKAQVSGFSGAEYKSFPSYEEALAFMGGDPGENDSFSRDFSDLPEKCAVAYVDGSFRVDTGEFSYGVVMFHKGIKQHFSGKSSDETLSEMRNVAGEIKGAEAAISYCLENGVSELDIYHDYEGIAKWCTGEWKANKIGTQDYRDFYRKASEKINITFHKVKGHSGVLYNEEADSLAKKALGL